jgi:hypothetical protein
MVKRFLLLVVACAACATVADLEVNRPVAEPGTSDRDGEGVEDGAAPVGDARNDSSSPEDTGPSALACNCDAGSACCIRSSASPACDVPSCSTEPGSLVVGCVRSTNDGRDCCWRPDAGTALASFGAGGCKASTAACQLDGDCAGQGDKCTTLTCKGVTLGVCAASAPPWFVCPP